MLSYTDDYGMLYQIYTWHDRESVPVLDANGKNTKRHVAKALEADTYDYVSQPFQPKEVLARSHRMIPQVAQ